MLGGTLEVQSSPGAGTQITLALPKAQESAVVEEKVMDVGMQVGRTSEVLA